MTKKFILLALICVTLGVRAQTINVAFQDINFGGTGVTTTNIVGNGKSTGNIILYENVINVGGVSVDAIMRTVYTSSGMINYDNNSTNIFGTLGNDARFFTPQFNFGSAGEAKFRIEFIQDNTFNSSTYTGNPVTLQNFAINSYDIDGDGNSNAYQYNSFASFTTSALGTNSNIVITYDSTSSLTTFKSNTTANNTNVYADSARIMLTFASLNAIELVVGADDAGQCVFFFDFGGGVNWSSTPDTTSAPILELSHGQKGIDRNDTFCNAPVPFSNDSVNIHYALTSIDEMRVFYDTATVIDSLYEYIVIAGATAGDSLPLVFNSGATFPDINLSGTNYKVTAIVSGNTRMYKFTTSNGPFTLSKAELLLDSMRYYNAMPSVGIRELKLQLLDSIFQTTPASYNVLTDCNALPLEDIELQVNEHSQGVQLSYNTIDDIGTALYVLSRSEDLEHWTPIDEVWKNTSGIRTIDDNTISHERVCYRLQVFDMEYQLLTERVECTDNFNLADLITVYPNPSSGIVQLSMKDLDACTIDIMNATGENVTDAVSLGDHGELDFNKLSSGMYLIQVRIDDHISLHRVNIVR